VWLHRARSDSVEKKEVALAMIIGIHFS
jgi:hypothetical protein